MARHVVLGDQIERNHASFNFFASQQVVSVDDNGRLNYFQVLVPTLVVVKVREFAGLISA
jgi:hypothetical protein